MVQGNLPTTEFRDSLLRDLTLLIGDQSRILTHVADLQRRTSELVERVAAYRGPMADDPEKLDQAAETWNGIRRAPTNGEVETVLLSAAADHTFIPGDQFFGSIIDAPHLTAASCVTDDEMIKRVEEAKRTVGFTDETDLPEVVLPPEKQAQAAAALDTVQDQIARHLAGLDQALPYAAETATTGHASPGMHTGTQSEGPAGSTPGEGVDGRDGDDAESASEVRVEARVHGASQSTSFVTVAGSGEVAPELDPVPDGPNWDDVVDARLSELWREGYKTASIAADLSARFKPRFYTKNMVIGRSRKLELGDHPRGPGSLPAHVKPSAPVALNKMFTPAPQPTPHRDVPLNLQNYGGIQIDEASGTIEGPKGRWIAPRGVARVVRELAVLGPNQSASADLLYARGLWKTKPLFMSRFPMYADDLRNIGIELLRAGKEAFAIRLVEEVAF